MDKMHEENTIQYTDWDDGFSVGSSLIDNQHKEILSFINYVADYFRKGKDSEEEFEKIVHMGIQQLENHFCTEEQIMDAAQFAGFTEHKIAHDGIKKELEDKLQEVNSTNRAEKMIEISDMLSAWIVNHIKNYDLKAAECFTAAEKQGKQGV
ncbi:MAG: bacteriohemerythrin [Spirochaetaceae bacterium]|jgi:hemerythrin|nr:bacteriohemerythrin [Spirochaetaceae bacterium]